MAESKEVRDFLHMLRRRNWPMGIFSVIVLSIAGVVAYVLPAEYRSTGILMFEDSGMYDEFVNKASPAKSELQINTIAREVLTTDQLKDIGESVDPYPGEELGDAERALRVSRDTEIEQVDPITREPSDDYPAFAVSYYNHDPEIAQAVCRILLHKFVSQYFAMRQEAANQAYQFLETEATRFRKQIDDAENALSQFKQKYGESLPDSERVNRDSLQRANDELIEINRQIRDSEDKLADVRLRMSGVSPTLENAGTNVPLELAQLEKQLAEARQRYTEDHPDVKRLRAAVQELRSRLAASGSKSTQTPGTAAVLDATVPDNPAYIALANEEKAILRDLDALQGQAQSANADIANYRSRLQSTPEVEQQFLTLNRDYELAQEQYLEIRRKQASAQLAMSLENSQKGQTISVLQDASRPVRPYSPNRLGILLLAVLFAVAGSLAIAVVLEMMDATVRGSTDLINIVDIQPMAAIPYIANADDVRRSRVKLLMIILLSAAVAAAATLSVGLL